jgi:hypothetical protein
MAADKKIYSMDKVFLNLSIIFNYLFYIIFNSKELFFIFSIIIILSFFSVLISIFKSNRILFLFFSLMLIISLGSAVQVWDARSIFMFNAKRIFFENNFNDYFKSFGINTHYPIFYPVLAATLNNFFSHWSEIIPKISILFLSLVPLINIYNEIKDNKKLLFTFLFILTFEHRVLNGDLDVLIALYFINSIILINKIIKINYFNYNNYLLIVELLLSNIIFLLTKPQSWSLSIALVISLFIILTVNKIKLKKILLILSIILISTIPALHWKFITFNNYNYVISDNLSLNFLLNNFLDFNKFFKTFFLILDKFIIQKSVMIMSIFLTFVVLKNYYSNKSADIKKLIKSNMFLMLLLSSIIYFFSLLIINLSITNDLETILNFTVDRYIVPINMMSLYIGFMFLNGTKS